MKKAFDQTVRDIKREVNKKVLKVPSIEQKVLDATSNEPWGPHGSLLADIAQSTRNYHGYQMIMSVIWKRINDTGKNWRHVYKALTVLEYLVAHGSERVIDDIREHAYQISTLSDFQYIDSSGKDQGSNVRKKSQSLVVLVNDKERIQEVRQKATANRDKYRNTSMGGMYKPGSFSSLGGYGDRYDDDRYESRYGNRDGDHNAYGRERDSGARDGDRYGRYGDSYGRDRDRYTGDYEERHGQSRYRDDDYRGRGQSIDEYHYGSRSRSADRDRDHAYEDDSQYSSRGSGAKADDHSQDGSTTGKRLDCKYSEQNLGAPPSYEEQFGATCSPTYSERDGESSLASAPKTASPPAVGSPAHVTDGLTPPPGSASPPAPASSQAPTHDSNKEGDGFDEFDPRGSFSAAPTTSNGAAPASPVDVGMDLIGSLSEAFSSNSLALMAANQQIMAPDVNASNFSSELAFVTTSSASTLFDDPFGEGTFKAIPSADCVSAQQQSTTSTSSFNTNSSHSLDVTQTVPQKAATEFGGTLYDATNVRPVPSGVQPPPTNTEVVQQVLLTHNQDVDILADILPPSASSSFVISQTGYPVPAGQSATNMGFPTETYQPTPQSDLSSLTSQGAQENSFPAQTDQSAGFLTQHGQLALQTNFPQSAESVSQTSLPQPMALSFEVQVSQASHMAVHLQGGQPTSFTGLPSQMGSSRAGVQAPHGVQSLHLNPPNPNFYGANHSQLVSTAPVASHMVPPSSGGPIMQESFLSQSGPAVPVASKLGPQAPRVQPSSGLTTVAPVSTMPASTGSSAIVQPPKDKFEAKSSVWADTLSRGLVNLNISGPKTNPLADIGVDFDAINRKEKRMEKPTTTTVTSTVTMGKAMGSGSGIGRAGASALGPPPNRSMGSGMNIGMSGGPGAGMGMGGYGVSQQMGSGIGMGMNMPGSLGGGMNMGMGQGIHVQQQTGYPPGSTIPGAYNPLMGTGFYGQHPYGRGYR